MGSEFAQQTYIILILIALSSFFETLTNLPSLVNDGLSFPKITGFFAFARALFSVLAISLGAIYHGLIGVAVAYFISSLIFGISFLLYVHKKTIKISFWILTKEAFLKSLLFSLTIVSGMLLFRFFLPTTKLTFWLELSFMLMLYGFFAYRNVLSNEWKVKITGYLPLIRQHK